MPTSLSIPGSRPVHPRLHLRGHYYCYRFLAQYTPAHSDSQLVMFRELGVGVSGGVLGKEAVAVVVSSKMEPRVDWPGSWNGERSWHRAFLCPLICSPQVRQ